MTARGPLPADPRPTRDPATPDLHSQWRHAQLDAVLDRLAVALQQVTDSLRPGTVREDR
ncbi:hypothetical protein [Streptomyces violascens]|uniref:Uncharacterized protein n=1 Tax=Streptomyces violascens TaxID=67381 RepID=A0ABQ3QL51_9ACTN|nr:hypothetical protein [Streptomyces violascens]GGU44440.1 hypothetical protein GCM10010289_76270 [Streptomyces violascens]GHI37998.1 hypothetical protein Sviol_24060 [Streptomyces violascens]